MVVMGMEGNLEHCDGGLARGMVPGYGPAMATSHSSFGWALHLSSHPHSLVGVTVSLVAEEGADPSVAERSGASFGIVHVKPSVILQPLFYYPIMVGWPVQRPPYHHFPSPIADSTNVSYGKG